MKKRIQKNRIRGRMVDMAPLYELTGKLTGVSAKTVEGIIAEQFAGLRDWTANPITHKAFTLPYIGRFEIKSKTLDKLVGIDIPKFIEGVEDEQELELHKLRLEYYKKVQKQQKEYKSRFDERTEKFRKWHSTQKELKDG